MNTLLIEPRDSLLVRDARPFSGEPGARARSLDFPFPSTLAGAVRTRLGQDARGVFQVEKRDEVLGIGIRGPLLCSLDDSGGPAAWWMPVPGDSVLFQQEGGGLRRECLAPVSLPPGAQTDLDPSLLPLSFAQAVPAKPAGEAPRFWRWDGPQGYRTWLERPESGTVHPTEMGLGGLPREARVHVSVGRETWTASEGRLYSTEGLRFTASTRRRGETLGGTPLSGVARFALALGVDHAQLERLRGVAPLAGERRLCAWRPVATDWPELPAAVEQSILKHRAARLVLLTPGVFAQGWRPSDSSLGGATLVAAAVRRPEVVAGWDLALAKPKPSRRAAPAGSVYFVRLPQGMSEDEARAWVRQHWLTSLCEQSQDVRDGFGLHVVGVWDGQAPELSGRAS